MKLTNILTEAQGLEARLLAKYENVPLQRYISYRGSEGAGHCLIRNGKRIGGASAGTLELKILFDLVRVIDARFSLQIGIAFGLSTLAMAEANRNNEIIAMDNYSENEEAEPGYVQAIAQKVLADYANVRLMIACSPQDTARCLRSIPLHEKLSLVLIDAHHTEESAMADFVGIHPYLDSHSVVLWHDIDKLSGALDNAFDKGIFDTVLRLPTWGRMGVHLNGKSHPRAIEYLKHFL
jgi:predicted O-methyltransferase YrrM